MGGSNPNLSTGGSGVDPRTAASMAQNHAQRAVMGAGGTPMPPQYQGPPLYLGPPSTGAGGTPMPPQTSGSGGYLGAPPTYGAPPAGNTAYGGPPVQGSGSLMPVNQGGGDPRTAASMTQNHAQRVAMGAGGTPVSPQYLGPPQTSAYGPQAGSTVNETPPGQGGGPIVERDSKGSFSGSNYYRDPYGPMPWGQYSQYDEQQPRGWPQQVPPAPGLVHRIISGAMRAPPNQQMGAPPGSYSGGGSYGGPVSTYSRTGAGSIGPGNGPSRGLMGALFNPGAGFMGNYGSSTGPLGAYSRTGEGSAGPGNGPSRGRMGG